MLEYLAKLVASDADHFNRVELYLRELPAWALGLLAVGIVAAVAASIAAVATERRAPRLALASLRLASALLLLVIVLGPSLEMQKAIRIPGRVAVLVDSSRSMALEASSGRTRLELAQEIAAAASNGLEPRFKVELVRFDDGTSPLAAKGLAGLIADGPRTDIAGALAALQATDASGDLSGIVVVTDGADTVRLAGPEDVGRRLREWPAVPVFTVPVTDPATLRDLALVNLRFDDFGFARHELVFDVELLARGFAGQRAAVALKRDGRPLTTQVVEIESADARLPLAFPVMPDLPGVYLYSIEVTPLAGESIDVNNRVEFAVTIGRDQLRVLLICGRPSWDERFLRDLLKQDPNVDLVSFFILRDADDNPGVPQDELSLIPFPVNELFTTELANFDLVILQNLDRRPFLSNLHLENLREFVVNGGGLLLVGGDLGLTAGGYAGSAIEDVLPFRLTFTGSGIDERPFKPMLTAAGESHFITRLEPRVDATRQVFESLPALDGTNVVGSLAPGAVVLLEHPQQSADGQPMPVLAARSVGKGRTLALTVDTSWYWNFKAIGAGGTNRDYLRFWQNAMRWLSSDQASKFLQVRLGAAIVEPAVAEEIRVRALGGDYAPLAGGRLRVRVRDASTDSVVIDREEVTDAAGNLTVPVIVAAEGFYRVEVALLDARGRPIDREERLYEVRADRTEIQDPAIRTELLDAIARATGGRMLRPDQAGKVPVPESERFRLDERRRIELWDNGWVYAALMLTLSGEWWLRRRAGLA